jgi:hypothetical protein
MSVYPDWVNKHKKKGTSVKKVGNSYYLYKSTSRRVPGKKYPQPMQDYLGKITPDGLVKAIARRISTETVFVYEYGFSFTLSRIIPPKFTKDIKDDEKAQYAFLNIIKHYSPDSYLLRNITLPTMEELHISLCAQIKKFERLAGVKMNELLPLARIYLVETKECDMISAIKPEMESILAKVGVNADDLQG